MPGLAQLSARRLGLWSVVGAASLWGVSGAVAKGLFQANVSPLELVHIRMLASGLILLAFVAVVHPARLRVARALWPRLIILGVAGLAMVQFTYFLAIEWTNVATAVFLQYTSPVWVALYAWLARGERPNLAAIALALTGAGVLVVTSPGGWVLNGPGLAAGLAASGFMAFYTLYGQATAARLDGMATLAWGLLIGGIFWTVVRGPGSLSTWGRFPFETWAWFGFIAVFATAIPFSLYFAGLRRLPAVEVSIVAMLEPVVAAFAAWVLVGERVSPVQWLGGILILFAVRLVERRERADSHEPAVGAGR